jgi:hypothetical protein
MVLVLRRSWRPVFALGLALYALALAVLIHFATRASWLRPLVVKPCQDFAGFGNRPFGGALPRCTSGTRYRGFRGIRSGANSRAARILPRSGHTSRQALYCLGFP